MEKSDIEFQAKLNLKNYREFNFYHFYRNFKSVLFLISLPIIFIGLPLMIYYYVKTEDLLILLLITTDLMFAIFMFILLPMSIFINTKLTYRGDEVQQFKINNEEILITIPRQEILVSWEKLYKTIETKGYFFIYLSKSRAFIIPKNQIDENEIKFLSKKFNSINVGL